MSAVRYDKAIRLWNFEIYFLRSNRYILRKRTSKRTFEDGESDILRNEYFELGAELVTNFVLEYRRLGESANEKHVL